MINRKQMVAFAGVAAIMEDFFRSTVPDKVEIVDQRQIKKQHKHLGNFRLQPGQKVWELNGKTRMIREVTEFQTAATIKGGVYKKFVTKEDCLYAIALNLKNAERHFLKMFP